MIGFQTLKALREAKGDRTEPESVHRLADGYWKMFLIVSAVAIIASISFGLRQFYVPPPYIEAGPTVGEGTATFDRAQLQATLKALEDRQAKFDALSH